MKTKKIAKPTMPGHCEYCGRLMIMVALPETVRASVLLNGANRSLGWRCLVCGQTVDVHSVVHRHGELCRVEQRRYAASAD